MSSGIFTNGTLNYKNRVSWGQCMRILSCVSMNKSPHYFVDVSGKVKDGIFPSGARAISLESN